MDARQPKWQWLWRHDLSLVKSGFHVDRRVRSGIEGLCIGTSMCVPYYSTASGVPPYGFGQWHRHIGVHFVMRAQLWGCFNALVASSGKHLQDLDVHVLVFV